MLLKAIVQWSGSSTLVLSLSLLEVGLMALPGEKGHIMLRGLCCHAAREVEAEDASKYKL